MGFLVGWAVVVAGVAIALAGWLLFPTASATDAVPRSPDALAVFAALAVLVLVGDLLQRWRTRRR